MSGMDFEYAIKKDVRNNPIVREVDEARQRQLWRTMGIGLFLVVVLLFSAWQHFELLRHGYQIERMQQERAAEEEVNRHLRLEIETLRAPRRIERIATEQLHLVAPAPGPGHRHRARDAGGAPREIHRRRALRPHGNHGGHAAVAARTASGARPRVARRARREPAPLDWRGTIRVAAARLRRRARPRGPPASRRGSSTCRSSVTPT